MKLKFLFILLAITQISFAQSAANNIIDTSNYYKFIQSGQGISINWLRESDVVPIIIDELQKKGIPYYKIGTGRLIKVNDSTRFVITVSFEKLNKKYGFLYESDHGIPLNKRDRNFLFNKQDASYIQTEIDLKDQVKFMRIDPLPKNIFLLKETCYWFQFDEKGTKYPVSKEIAENILRQDIDNYLK